MPKRAVTAKELQAIQDSAAACGFDRRAIAQQLGMPPTRLNNILDRNLATWWPEAKRAFDLANGPESTPSKVFSDVLAVPVRPFAVPVPIAAKPLKGRWQHAVVFGDSHHPWQDDACLQVVQGIIADVRPQRIVHLGDLLDCYTISKFSPDPTRLTGLQAEIDSGRRHLHQIASLAPQAEKLLLGGNHEDRLRKMIWDLRGAQRELARLRIFQRAMTWPALLELDAIGWSYCDYTQQPTLGFLPKLVLKHGDVARKWSSWSAKAEWEKHAKGGLSGHTHRLGSFYHRDLNGSHLWNETGCTCRLDPEYVRQPDWQQGCVVITHDDSRFQSEAVYIQDGKAIWRSKEFAA